MQRHQARFMIVLAVFSIVFLAIIAEARSATLVLSEQSTPPTTGEACGQSVALGDVNGDSRADAVVGCPGTDTAGLDAGSARVWKATDKGGFNQGERLLDATLTANVSEQCGRSVAIGDMNADKRGDVFVGCPATTVNGVVNAGSVLVFPATDTGFGPPIEVLNPAPSEGDYCTGYGSSGTGLAVADLNADGKSDLLMGCANSAGATSSDLRGRVEVFTATGTGFTRSLIMVSPTPSDGARCGSSISTGDLDGDKRVDVIAGCPTSTISGRASAGSVLAFLRLADGTYEAGRSVRAPKPVAQDMCGSSVAVTAGSVVAGCPGRAKQRGGVIRTAFQTTTRSFPASVVVVSRDAASGDSCGSSLAEGALAGSGKSSTTLQDDVFVGCSKDDTTAKDSGGASVITAGGDARSIPIAGSSQGASCGSSVGVMALNATHPEDFVIGCPTSSVSSVSGAGIAIVSTALAPAPSITALLNGKDCMTSKKRCKTMSGDSLTLSIRPVPKIAARTPYALRVERRVKGTWRHVGRIESRTTATGRGLDTLKITTTGPLRVLVDLPATSTTASVTRAAAYVTLS